jgi:hypothetical protein
MKWVSLYVVCISIIASIALARLDSSEEFWSELPAVALVYGLAIALFRVDRLPPRDGPRYKRRM